MPIDMNPLTPEEEQEWKRLKTQANTKQDWLELHQLIIAFKRGFIRRHRESAATDQERLQ